jgi:hypothetical protein
VKLDGSCHCGKIRFEAEADPGSVSLCHCADCQTLCGSPYRASVPVAANSLSLTGEPSIYVKTAESGNRRAQAFCATCGSHIYAAAPDKPSVYMMRLGSIRQRDELGPPARQIWCESALGWSMLDTVPRVARDK